jgi:putative FmdB family regulatory protein
MPIYAYKCSCGEKFDRFLKMANSSDPQHCQCGKVAEKQLTCCSVAVMQSYQSPISGKWIDTPRQRRNDLNDNNCREWEGIEQETKVAHQREKDFDKMLDKSAEKSAIEAWQQLPQETKLELQKSA